MKKNKNYYTFRAGKHNKIFNFEMLMQIEEIKDHINTILPELAKQLQTLNDSLYININQNSHKIYVYLDCNTCRVDSPKKLEYFYTEPQGARIVIYSPEDIYYNRKASKCYEIGEFRNYIDLNISHFEIGA